MTLSISYPGVYIQELDPGVRVITGVATSVTAFLGRALRGPVDDPVRVQSFADFERRFGGLWTESPMSHAVRHFFLNRGGEALIVRVHAPGASDGTASGVLAAEDAGNPLGVRASNPGRWGNGLQVSVDHDTADRDSATPVLFNLLVQEVDPARPGAVLTEERHRNLSVDPAHARFVTQVLAQESDLVVVDASLPLPTARPLPIPPGPPVPLLGGDDGNPIGDGEITGSAGRGLWALDKADVVNLVCIPPFSAVDEVDPATWDAAATYCEGRRAILLVDPPSAWNSPDDVDDAAILAQVVRRSPNAALYFPRIRVADPLKENRLDTFAPCGAVAGVIARTDATRGVWKAPAGQEATLAGAQALEVGMTDKEQGNINPLGVNCLRTFRVAGRVVWGARTLAGADQLASQSKYLPMRRLTLFLEESLYRGTQWVVFEPNDEPLWSQIRLNIGAFMQGLFVQGAFQGTTPREAYLVKCDRETTTQADVDRGIVNILVGFAALKPAEFVVVRIKQLAGQVET